MYIHVIVSHLEAQTNLVIQTTVHSFGYKAWVRSKKPLINKKNRLERVVFAKDHLKKPKEFWNTVLIPPNQNLTYSAGMDVKKFGRSTQRD